MYSHENLLTEHPHLCHVLVVSVSQFLDQSVHVR